MNTKIMLTLAALAMVAGCERPAEAVAHAEENCTVVRLFTPEGCTVFRFTDGNRRRYFARCDDSVAQPTTTRQESCGENCTPPVEVSGGQP